MKNKTENQLREFYDTHGWKADEAGYNQDAALWEDLRKPAADYVKACRLRIMNHLPKSGEFILDAASGPIQYPEYLEYSKNFKKRYCVDISKVALEKAKKNLGEKGEYIEASLLDLPFESNFFDASLSLHTIYHIEAAQQERAVNELLRVTKVGAPIIIIYANPDRPTHKLKSLLRPQKEAGPIYYHAHSLSWWKRFESQASVEIFNWRTLTANLSKKLIPNSSVGKMIFDGIFRLEEAFPSLAVALGAYPMIVLRKR